VHLTLALLVVLLVVLPLAWRHADEERD